MTTTQFQHGYALLIGVGECQYPKLSLPVTVRDAEEICATLVAPDLCGYPDDTDHVRLLSNHTATAKGILDGVAWLSEKAAQDAEATAVIFYSGHGWLKEDSGEYYLIPHDFDPFDPTGTAVNAVDFANAVRKIGSSRLLVFIDSCHAEGMASSKDTPGLKIPKGFASVALPKGLSDALLQGQGRAVFTSSRGTESSWVRKDGKLSIFTHHLIEAFHGSANQPGDTTIRISNLANHLSKTVPQSARSEHGADQTPYFSWESEDFVVALLLGGKGLSATGVEQSSQVHDKSQVFPDVHADRRGVAAGRDMTGNTTIIGDGNTIGNHNIRVDKIENARNFAIGSSGQVLYQEGSSPDQIAGAFARIYQSVQMLPNPSQQADARQAVEKLEAEARKGNEADEGRVERWLSFLLETAEDAWEVAVKTLSNPIQGISTVFQKVTERARREREEKQK